MIEIKNQEEVPLGKVCCFLCGGIISLKGGDRSRFIDHMTNEHDAKKFSHDLLLAICVFNRKDHDFIVKSSNTMIKQIALGLKPSNANVLSSVFDVSSIPSQNRIIQGRGRGRPTSSGREVSDEKRKISTSHE